MPDTTLTHRARLELTLMGEKPDRIPVALWRHFPVDDQVPESLAAATADFQLKYDFDLIKVTPASSFCLKDWGILDEWRGNPEGVREYTNRIILHPEDWEKLTDLSPEKGFLGAQLHCLEHLVKEFSSHTPIIQTIFSPLAQAKNLAGKSNLQVMMRRHPAALHAGLETITRTTLAYVEKVVKMGVDGIFFAVQHAQYELLSEAEFLEFGRAYDLPVLNAAKHLWLNMAHIHGKEIMFDPVSEYPVSILNWHDQETTPTLDEGKNRFAGTVCGGLRQWDTLVNGTPEQVKQEAHHAMKITQGKRFILGTGCVVPVTAPHANILAARKSVERADLE